VQRRIASACQRVGRDPASVRLLPVSKTFDEAHLRLAYVAGCRLLRERLRQDAPAGVGLEELSMGMSAT
jgi:uncharacterized pyridoxal phosphate-containing UPF0001 family protein